MGIGVVRRVDKLGRVVIPIDIYRRFGIMGGDEVEISANENEIIIKTLHTIRAKLLSNSSQI